MTSKPTSVEEVFPATSESIRILLEMAGAESDAVLCSVKEILFITTMHPALIAGQLTVERLRNIIEDKRSDWADDIEASGLNTLDEGLEWLIDNADAITEKIPEYGKRYNTNRGNPLMGTAASILPIQTLLCLIFPEDEQHGHVTENLTAQLIVAYAYGLKILEVQIDSYFDATDESYASPLKNSAGPAARAIRKLSEDQHKDLALSLPYQDTPVKFFSALNAFETDDAEMNAALKALSRFGLKCLGEIDWLSRDLDSNRLEGFGGGKWRGNRHISLGGIIDDLGKREDDTSDLVEKYLIRFNELSPSQIRSALKDDLCPQEDAEEDGFFTVSILAPQYPKLTEHDPSATASFTQATAGDATASSNKSAAEQKGNTEIPLKVGVSEEQRNHILRRDMRLPLSTDFISAEELATLTLALSKDKSALLQAGIDLKNRINAEAILLLYLSVMFAVDLKNLINMQLRTDLPDHALTKNPVLVLIQDNSTEKLLLLAKAIEPNYTTTETNFAGMNIRTRAKFVTILDTGNFMPLVKALQPKTASSEKKSIRLFQSKEKMLLKKAIEYLQHTLSARVTSKKVADSMLSLVTRQFNDLTTACCALGLNHLHKIEVPLYYTTHTTDFLTQGHRVASSKLFENGNPPFIKGA